jgi:UrcA family protein
MKMILSLAALAAGAFVAPASAQDEAPVTRTAVVHTAGLDLSDPMQLAELDRRIDTTIKSLCHTPRAFDLGAGRIAAKRCRAEARANVAEQRQRTIIALSAPVKTAAR